MLQKQSQEDLIENVQVLAAYIERKINLTVDFQASRKQPSVFQRLIADVRMKARWQLPAEASENLSLQQDQYRADKSANDFESILSRQSVLWPTKEKMEARRSLRKERQAVRDRSMPTVVDEE